VEFVVAVSTDETTCSPIHYANLRKNLRKVLRLVSIRF